jgi:hypothetical protein
MTPADFPRRYVLDDHTDPGLVDEVRHIGRLHAGFEQRLDQIQEQQQMVDPKEFGRMQANLESLRRDFDILALSHREILKKLSDISEQLSEAKGGWKTLLMVGGVAGAFGSFITKAAVWFSQSGPK